MLIFNVNVRGEVVGSFTKWIDFQTGFIGSALHPNLRIGRFDATEPGFFNNYLYLEIIKEKKYYEFGENTRCLIKFADGTIIELNSEGEPTYEIEYLNTKPLYASFRKFELTENDLHLLLNQPITKVRIELFNGERLDYEVNESHGKKVLKNLQKEWEKVLKEQDRKINNTNNLRDGF